MTIGEFSAITEISAYTLRYYEKKGLLCVSRDSVGRRDYSVDDIEWVKFIQRLKDTGMVLRDIKYYSDLRYQGDDTMAERMELLVRHRKSVVEERKKWDEYLKNLDEKIGIYWKRINEK
ncbi:MerR family transcriptional regulator [Lachnospiraceae bacterium 62-35]